MATNYYYRIGVVIQGTRMVSERPSVTDMCDMVFEVVAMVNTKMAV
jgi:hypothetical protein